MDTILVDANADLYWKRLEDSPNCFEADESLVEPVRILDIPANKPIQHESVPVLEQAYSSAKTFQDFFDAPNSEDYGIRLISICQKNSWSKLQITKSMLKKMVQHHDIDPSFLEVPLSFFSRKTDEEHSFCVPWTVLQEKSSFQVFYSFRYAEYRGHPNEPWVIRHIGIYHKFDAQTKKSLYILIHASPDTEAHRRILKSLTTEHSRLHSNSLWLHVIVHSFYLMNWRGYISEYEKRLLPIADTTTATFINKPLRVNHDTLGTVRWLESRFMPLQPVLETFIEILEGLHALSDHIGSTGCLDGVDQAQVTQQLENSKRSARGFMRTALFLQRRSNNTATLLADTLAFWNQGVAQEQNGSILVLTRSAVFITVITLVYLPWTLVTGIFGMEFFEMDQQTQKLLTSPQIWIYVVTSMVVTALTMGLYYIMAGLPRSKDRIDAEHRKNGSYIPRSLSRGYTDIEKSPRAVET